MSPSALALVVGPASSQLGSGVCHLLEVVPLPCTWERFPDGEMLVELRDTVRGKNVFVIQATSPPVEQHVMELLCLADACRRAGAARLTAVIPYFGYARQDRRTGRQSLGARVIADVIETAGFDRLMLIDAHTPAIEGFFRVPIEHLTAVPLLARAALHSMGENAVVVAPDLGAVKRAREYARLLSVPMAFVQKTRLTGERVEAQQVVGHVQGRAPLVIDDMVSTGGTVEAAVRALRAAGAAAPVALAVTHALLAGRAHDVLAALELSRILATDTVPIDRERIPGLDILSVAPLIATAIRRDARDESLADLRAPA
jgi:ribose-phosphate pyrophosphokinase